MVDDVTVTVQNVIFETKVRTLYTFTWGIIYKFIKNNWILISFNLHNVFFRFRYLQRNTCTVEPA